MQKWIPFFFKLIQPGIQSLEWKWYKAIYFLLLPPFHLIKEAIIHRENQVLLSMVFPALLGS